MTNARANEILKTKYPTAHIFKRNEMGGASSAALAVTFKEGGKVYDYNTQSYADVLNRLGFTVLYKHEVTTLEKLVAELERDIAAGGYVNPFFESRMIYFSEETLADKKAQLAEYKHTLENAIVEQG